MPGWDCHGLPIELKVLQQMESEASKKDRKATANDPAAPDDLKAVPGQFYERKSPVVVRNAARKLASATIESQMEQFKRWAIMADWNNSYTTMQRSFELKQLRVFQKMLSRKLINRRYKPVYWSPSSETALAEGELEYKDDHKSCAAFVKFPVTKLDKLLELQGVDIEKLGILIWTTTPWTIPANKAIAVHSDIEYSVIECPSYGNLLVAKSRIPYIVAECLKAPYEVIVDSIPGRAIAGSLLYRNVFQGEAGPEQPIIEASFVSEDSGSGLVHCAPGHGMDDYEVCLQYGIKAVAPVDDHGRFTKSAMAEAPNRLSGLAVLKEGNKAVLDYLQSVGLLLRTHQYRHKYPYDWRTKLPVIVRATEQWFADVNGIKGAAMKSLEDVRFIPESGRSRLESFVQGRSEWCISRQRAWGVPIPALYDKRNGKPLLTEESVSHIISVIEERGIDAWWTDSEDDISWVPPKQAFESNEYVRGKDTMDVWFDSGTSWTTIAADASQAGRSCADVYLEGTDQHRGWFQSSLLTRIAHQHQSGLGTSDPPAAPFATLITHGFALDGDGKKMSKSLGNVIDPKCIIQGRLDGEQTARPAQEGKSSRSYLGPDGLRLWVAGSDYTKDVIISSAVLKGVATNLQKLRITFKLLLGLLSDFNPQKVIPYADLIPIDKVALHYLAETNQAVLSSFHAYEFHKGLRILNQWLVNDLSAFYIETAKDRLYTDAQDSISRRAAQTVAFHTLENLLGMLAPITPLLIEEVWSHTPVALQENSVHPLQRLWPAIPPEWFNESLKAEFEVLRRVGISIKDHQEEARVRKLMGSSLSCDVTLGFPDAPPTGADLYELFKKYEGLLADLYVVSGLTLKRHSEPDAQEKDGMRLNKGTEKGALAGVGVLISSPAREQCVRCWKYVVEEKKPQQEMLCKRCENVVRALPGGSANGSGVAATAA